MLLQCLETRNDMKILCQRITFSFQAFLTLHWYWFQLQEVPWASRWQYSLPADANPAPWCLISPSRTSMQGHPLANQQRKTTQKAGILTCYVRGHLSATWQLNVYWLAGVPCWSLNCLSLLLVTSSWAPAICSLPYSRRRSFLVFKQLSWNCNEGR